MLAFDFVSDGAPFGGVWSGMCVGLTSSSSAGSLRIDCFRLCTAEPSLLTAVMSRFAKIRPDSCPLRQVFVRQR
jgi:hypothetical protein